MADTIRTEDANSEIERDILKAFGWAIVEFEETLYHKYLIMSAAHSLMSRDRFKKYLANMQAKGYVAPLKLHGVTAWKKLVVEDRIDDTLLPRPIKMAKRREKEKPQPRERVVSESHVIAQDILRTMHAKLYPCRGNNEKIKNDLKIQAQQMRKALSRGRREFMDFIRKKAPTLREPMELILSSKGEEILLLSLRLIETGEIYS